MTADSTRQPASSALLPSAPVWSSAPLSSSARRAGKRELAALLADARRRLWTLLDDLAPAQWDVPLLPTVNPPLWEAGHAGYFAEWWCLRDPVAMAKDGHWRSQPPRPSLLGAQADALYDSSRVAHAARWDLALPDIEATRRYLANVLQRCQARLEDAGEDDASLYFFRLALFHEDMHCEALAMMRQTLAYRHPAACGYLEPAAIGSANDGDSEGDIRIPAGVYQRGAERHAGGFSFDNERAGHPVRVETFSIARRPVNNREFLAFVTAGGYRHREWWAPPGLAWLDRSVVANGTSLHHPCYWRRYRDRWQQRFFERWIDLAPDSPVMHLTAFEAEAFCCWAGRRLPTETEWEVAAKLGMPWGNSVWEWTADSFEPYERFTTDPYVEYSQPWFHTHRSVRSGSFATSPRLLDPTFRNFYLPERADVFIGFRTCAR